MEFVVPFEGGCINVVRALPLPSTTPACFVAAGSSGLCSLYQCRSTPEGGSDYNMDSGASVTTLDRLAHIAVSKSAVRCLEVSSLDSLPTAIATAEDGSIVFIKLTSRIPSILDSFSFAPDITQRMAVPAAVAPTALAFSGFNELVLFGDAYGGISLQNVRDLEKSAAAMYSATLEGGSGPCIHAAAFWSYNPNALLLAAGSKVYNVDARAPRVGTIASSVAMPTPTGSTPLCLSTFPDDPFLIAYGCVDGSATVADLRRPDVPWAHMPDAASGPVWSVSPVPRSSLVLVGGEDGTARLLELNNPSGLATMDSTASLTSISTVISTSMPINSVCIGSNRLVVAGDECGFLHGLQLDEFLAREAAVVQ